MQGAFWDLTTRPRRGRARGRRENQLRWEEELVRIAELQRWISSQAYGFHVSDLSTAKEAVCFRVEDSSCAIYSHRREGASSEDRVDDGIGADIEDILNGSRVPV